MTTQNIDILDLQNQHLFGSSSLYSFREALELKEKARTSLQFKFVYSIEKEISYYLHWNVRI